MKIRRNPYTLIIIVFLALFLKADQVTANASIEQTGAFAGSAWMQNPAEAYCADLMGYTYQILELGDGSQSGVCVLPDQTICDQWEFYAGQCGSAYSYCARQGYNVETREDGQDAFAQVYAACVDENGNDLGSTSVLSGLAELVRPECLNCDAAPFLMEGERPAFQAIDTLPTAIDWRNYQGANWLTGVKNQASCGSCWAFAAIGSAEAHHNIITANPNLDLNLSEQDLVSCSGAGGCGGGSSSAALEYMRDSGVVDEACFPYVASDVGCSKCADWQSRLTFVDEVGVFIPDRTSLKQSIVDFGPTVVYLGVGSDYGGYFDGNHIYRCSNDSANGNYGINHAVVAVGYNDSGSYWIIRNSWGASWNGDGYFNVGYDECNIDRTLAVYPYVLPPVTTHSLAGTLGADGWYVSNVTVSFSVNEPVQETKYRLDGGTWQNYTASFSVTGDGSHVVEYYSKDVFGGQEVVKSASFKIDQTAPSNPTTINSGCGAQNAVWQNTCTSPAFSWSGADDHGGVGVQDYHVYWGENISGIPSFWTISALYNPGPIVPINDLATYYLRLATRDALEHEAVPETVFTFRYDGSVPTVMPVIADGVPVVTTLNVWVAPGAMDTGSGVSVLHLSYDGVSWQSMPYAEQVMWWLQPLSRQRQPLYLMVEDEAGNISEPVQEQVCLNLYPPHPASDNYWLWSAGPVASGGQASSDNYQLQSTGGQSAMGGMLSSQNFQLHSGFQAMWPADPGAEMFTPFVCTQITHLPFVIRK